MSDDREVCPACGHRHLYRRRSGVRTGRDTTAAYRCEDCGATFDDPDTREAFDRGGLRGDSLAAELDDAAPDEVGP